MLTASAAQAEIKTEWIEYTHGDTKLKGYLAYDDAVTGKRPAILMIHDRAGMQPYTQKHAETYAKLGYVTFVADFFGYGQGILPKDVPEAAAQMAIYIKDRALMKARAQAGYDVLVKNPMVDATKVALIGYCFGGMVGVDFGSTGVPLGANVAIHGSFDGHPEGWAKNVKGKFLILHGAEDVPYPLEKVAVGLQRAAQGQGRIPDGVLQRRRPRLLGPEEQGRGARQRAVDRRDRTVPRRQPSRR